MTLIKSISGIRGTIGGLVGENLTPLDIVKFTTAYTRVIARNNPGKHLTIVIGRDARLSGELVMDLVEGTLLACGVLLGGLLQWLCLGSRFDRYWKKQKIEKKYR